MFDLKSFLKVIENKKEHYVKVKREVNYSYEATGILEKLEYEQKYPLVYFKKIKGSDIPVVSNVFASSFNRE